MCRIVKYRKRLERWLSKVHCLIFNLLNIVLEFFNLLTLFSCQWNNFIMRWERSSHIISFLKSLYFSFDLLSTSHWHSIRIRTDLFDIKINWFNLLSNFSSFYRRSFWMFCHAPHSYFFLFINFSNR